MKNIHQCDEFTRFHPVRNHTFIKLSINNQYNIEMEDKEWKARNRKKIEDLNKKQKNKDKSEKTNQQSQKIKFSELH